MKKLLPAIALVVVFSGGVWFGSLFSFVAARNINRYTGQALESFRTVSDRSGEEKSSPSNRQERSGSSFSSDFLGGRQSNSGGTGGGNRGSAAAVNSASGGDATFDNITVLNKAVVNGRVGIGTVNPTAKLEINGGAELNPEIRFLSGADNKSTRLTMGRGWVDATLAVPGIPGAWFTNALAGDLIIRTEKGSGRILLGVNSSDTAPVSALTIDKKNVSVTNNLFWNYGRSVLKSNQGGSIELGDGTVQGETPYLDFHYGTGSKQDYNFRIINNQNGTLALQSGGASNPAMVIRENGNVGIGTANPSYKVHIDGGSEPNVNLVLQNDIALGRLGVEYSNSLTKRPGLVISAEALNPYLEGIPDINFNVRAAAFGEKSSMMISGMTGFVGINNTDPITDLDVKGYIKSTGLCLPDTRHMDDPKKASYACFPGYCPITVKTELGARVTIYVLSLGGEFCGHISTPQTGPHPEPVVNAASL